MSAARLIEAGCVRLPGTWDGFEVAVRALVAADVGPAFATEIIGRLALNLGLAVPSAPRDGPTRLFPSPAALAEADFAAYGLSGRTGQRLQQLARAVCSSELSFLPPTSFADLAARLERAIGFDQPTAHWIAMRTLGETDAVPFGARDVPGLEAQASAPSFGHERWRPWRSYVAVALVAAQLQAQALDRTELSPARQA